jgi:hypothetical protein
MLRMLGVGSRGVTAGFGMRLGSLAMNPGFSGLPSSAGGSIGPIGVFDTMVFRTFIGAAISSGSISGPIGLLETMVFRIPADAFYSGLRNTLLTMEVGETVGSPVTGSSKAPRAIHRIPLLTVGNSAPPTPPSTPPTVEANFERVRPGKHKTRTLSAT